jgi:predicted small lipoprotein YifL
MRQTLLFLAASLLLTACGTRGPLTLPPRAQPPAPAEMPKAKPAPAEDSSAKEDAK